MRITLSALLFLLMTPFSYADDSDLLNQKILSLLKAHSVDGARIVQMDMENADELNPVNPSEFLMFTPYTEQNIVNSLPTVVHESHHGLKRYGHKVVYHFSGRSDIRFEHDYHYLKDGNFSLVKITETFPSRELVSLFSDSLQKRFLFFWYIAETGDINTIQQDGIFGLLSEFNAYYQAAKTTIENWDRNIFWEDLTAISLRLHRSSEPIPNAWEPYYEMKNTLILN